MSTKKTVKDPKHAIDPCASQPPLDKLFTSYIHDVSDWGGLTHTVPDDLPKEVTLQEMERTRPSIRRYVSGFRGPKNFLQTPDSTYRAHYVSHFPKSRDVDAPMYSMRCPDGAPPPEQGDTTCFTGTTEYRDKYVPKPHIPFISQRTKERANPVPQNSFGTRSIRALDFNTDWSTTYRDHYCNRDDSRTTSHPVTFMSWGGRR